MSFMKGLFKGNPAKSAAKHETRARTYQKEGDEKRAGSEWAAAGRDYARIPNLKRARECFLQAARFYLAADDTRHEKEALQSACDIAFDAGDYEAAAASSDLLANIGTRQKDNQLLLQSLALKALAFLAANDLSKAKEAYREGHKVERRIGRTKTRFTLFQITKALIARFVDGEPIPDATVLPERAGESESVNRLVGRLLALYQTTRNLKLKLSLKKGEAKIKERISGICSFISPIDLQVIKTILSVPPNFSQVEPLNFQNAKATKFSAPFTIEAHLAGEFNIGPAVVILQIDKQHLQLKSELVPLRIEAATPHIQIIAESSPELRTQEVFELKLSINNSSHGDASDINVIITLPSSLLLQTGTLEKRIITLAAQQQVQFPIYLIATKSGTHEGTIECQYQGSSGERNKITHSFRVTVKPRPLKPKD